MDRFQKNETLVAAHEWPMWPHECRRLECARCRQQQTLDKPNTRCERRDLGGLVRRIEAGVPYRGFIKVLCASRLTDGVTLENFARLLELLPNLEVLDLTKTVGLTMPIMRHLLQSKLQLICVIDAVDGLAFQEQQGDLWTQWLTRVVWMGAYDFDKWARAQPPQEDDRAWRQCCIHHQHWFETVLLMHY
jgi:hypothetical protein